MFSRSIVFAFALLLVVPQLRAADAKDAEQETQRIVSMLASRKYEALYDQDTSAFLKNLVTKGSFIANLTMQRNGVGALQNSQLVSQSHSNFDPGSGYKGDIYVFDYLNTYAAGKFYERIVVVKDDDGQFRLSGYFPQPASGQ